MTNDYRLTYLRLARLRRMPKPLGQYQPLDRDAKDSSLRSE
jgi:hypothetical protein